MTQTRKRPRSAEENGSALHNKRVRSNFDYSKYAAGQILRVELENFQVTEKVAYNFHPGLNMIIGPNGSGKSTVVTGIYLALGGKSANVTAEHKYRNFIRIGQSRARVVVYMKGLEADSCVLVELTIGNDGSPRWTFDGRSVDTSTLQREVRRHGIHVGNLCQFLAQDRVASFSAESPNERLKSTMSAVGRSEMIQEIGRLQELGKESRRHEEEAHRNDDTIDVLKKSIERLEASVENLRRRMDDEKELQIWKYVPTLFRYNQLKEKKDECEHIYKELRDKERNFERENEHWRSLQRNAEAEISAAERELNQLERSKSSCRRDLDQELTILKGDATKTAGAMQKYKARTAEIESINEQIKSAQEEMNQRNRVIRNYEELLSTLDAESILAEYNRAKAACEEVKHKVIDLGKEKESFKYLRSDIRIKLSRAEAKLTDIKSSRLKLLNNEERQQIIAASKLIDENRSLFKEPPMPPPVLKMSFLEGADAQISANIQLPTLQPFICTNREDYGAVNRLFSSHNIRCRVVQVQPGSIDMRRPLTTEQLEDLGFDGYLIDLIKCDERYKLYFIAQLRLHQQPFSKGTVSHAATSRIMQLPGLPIRTFVDSQEQVSLRKSKYGTQQVSTSSRPIGSVGDYVQVLHTDIGEQSRIVREQIEGYKLQLEEIDEREKACKARIEALKPEYSRAEKEAERPAAAHQNLRANQSKLHVAQSDRDGLEHKITEMTRRRASVESQVERLSEELADAGSSLVSDRFSGVAEKLADIFCKLDAQRLRHQCAVSDKQQIVRLMDDAKQEHIEKINQAIKDLDDAKRGLNELKIEVRNIQNTLGADYEQSVEKAAQVSDVNEARSQIARLQAQLDLNGSGESYESQVTLLEQQKARYESLTRHRDDSRAAFEATQTVMQEQAPAFQDTCLRFVGQISEKFKELFARLSCEGEVVLLHPARKYEDWGIEIRVSYRTGEPMKALSSRSQSGGERAVATAVYLMALRELSTFPFVVVDEINQGMDRDNERMVHRLIVETARKEGSQFFMVTPKLLPDLVYDQCVNLLCNNSSVAVQHFEVSLEQVIASSR